MPRGKGAGERKKGAVAGANDVVTRRRRPPRPERELHHSPRGRCGGSVRAACVPGRSGHLVHGSFRKAAEPIAGSHTAMFRMSSAGVSGATSSAKVLYHGAGFDV